MRHAKPVPWRACADSQNMFMTTVFLLFLVPMVMFELSAHGGRCADHENEGRCMASAAVEGSLQRVARGEQN